VKQGPRRAWAASALVAAVAGCAPGAEPSKAPSSYTMPAEQVFTAGCPELPAAPPGVDRKGKLLPVPDGALERQTLNRLAPGAQIDHVMCKYSGSLPGRPGVEVNVRLFRGDKAAAQAVAVADAEQGTTSDMNEDFVTVPTSGDSGGFAWYGDSQFCLATHAGRAYVVVAWAPDGDGGKSHEQSLRHQLPTLTAIMNRVLAALK
jgi:hypothetical protein